MGFQGASCHCDCRVARSMRGPLGDGDMHHQEGGTEGWFRGSQRCGLVWRLLGVGDQPIGSVNAGERQWVTEVR